MIQVEVAERPLLMKLGEEEKFSPVRPSRHLNVMKSALTANESGIFFTADDSVTQRQSELILFFREEGKISHPILQIATSLPTHGEVHPLLQRDTFYLPMTDKTMAEVRLRGEQLIDTVAMVHEHAFQDTPEPARQHVIDPLLQLLGEGLAKDVEPDLLPVTVEKIWDLPHAMREMSWREFVMPGVGNLEMSGQPPRVIRHIFHNVEGKSSATSQQVEILQLDQDGNLRLTRSAAAILFKDLLLACELPDGTDIFVPVVATELERGRPEAVQYGVTMTAETLHQAAELVRKLLNNPINNGKVIPPELFETLTRLQFLSRTDFCLPGHRALSYLEPILPSATRVEPSLPQEAVAPPRVAPKARPPASSPLLPILPKPVAESGTPLKPAAEPAVPSAKPLEAEIDRRPAIFRTLDGYTGDFSHQLSSSEAAQALSDIVSGMKFDNEQIKGATGITLAFDKKGFAVLHVELQMNNRQMGVNLIIRNGQTSEGITVELKLNMLERVIAKSVFGETLEQIAQLPQRLIEELNAKLNNTRVIQLSLEDNNLVIKGSRK